MVPTVARKPFLPKGDSLLEGFSSLADLNTKRKRGHESVVMKLSLSESVSESCSFQFHVFVVVGFFVFCFVFVCFTP